MVTKTIKTIQPMAMILQEKKRRPKTDAVAEMKRGATMLK